MRKLLPYLVTVAISSILNISIFLIAYKKFTYPFLNEDQRLENAPLIILYVIPAFVVVSIVLVYLVQLFNKFKI
jgi:hypothetical protein